MGWIKTRISLLKNENGNNNIKISIHKTLPILGCVSGKNFVFCLQFHSTCTEFGFAQFRLRLGNSNKNSVFCLQFRSTCTKFALNDILRRQQLHQVHLQRHGREARGGIRRAPAARALSHGARCYCFRKC